MNYDNEEEIKNILLVILDNVKSQHYIYEDNKLTHKSIDLESILNEFISITYELDTNEMSYSIDSNYFIYFS